MPDTRVTVQGMKEPGLPFHTYSCCYLLLLLLGATQSVSPNHLLCFATYAVEYSC